MKLQFRAACLVLLAPLAFAQDIPEHPEQLSEPPLPHWTAPRPQRTELEGGGTLLVLEDTDSALVDGRLLFPIGIAHEDPVRPGLVSVLGIALREGGTRRMNGSELDQWLDEHGASLAVRPEREITRIEFSCLAEDLEEMLHRISELLVAPTYPSSTIDIAVQRLSADATRRSGDPSRLAADAVLFAAYGADSPWARVPDKEGLARIQREDVLEFHAKHFVRQGLLLGLSGKLPDLERTTEWIQTALENLPQTGEPNTVDAPAFLEAPTRTVYLIDRPGAVQTQLRLVGPGVRRLHPDYPALYLWSHVVGVGGMTHRMMLHVRTELGLAYSVGAFYRAGWGRAGRFEAYCATRSESAAAALSAMFEVLAKARAPIPEEELNRVRERVRGSQFFDVDTAVEALDRALLLELHDYPRDFLDRARQQDVDALSPKTVAEAVERHLDLDHCSIIAVGPAALLEEPLAPWGEVVRMDEYGRILASRAPLPEEALAMYSVLGGRERWSTLGALQRSGVMEIPQGEGNAPVEAGIRMWQTYAPRRSRREIDLGETTTTLASDGPSCWSQVIDAIEPIPTEACEKKRRSDASSLYSILRRLARGEGMARAMPLEEGSRLAPLRVRFEEDSGELIVCTIRFGANGLPRSMTRDTETPKVTHTFLEWTENDDGFPYVATSRQESSGIVLRTKEFLTPEALDEDLFMNPLR